MHNNLLTEDTIRFSQAVHKCGFYWREAETDFMEVLRASFFDWHRGEVVLTGTHVSEQKA
ncbi:hypothetical protein [Galbibacter mesophilus]|uniref:hypothetical protein n=1 Tax=Galbibacter mesophilus TaxID=379069 RepID=UPI00191E34B1|nr:hypothetical protein [Galbibacter mesophilus]MCM5663664.1 hypothetical protein [Galbibacter mesophilus]